MKRVMKKGIKRELVLTLFILVLIINLISAQNCQLTNASWSTQSANESDIVTLTVTGSDCNGKQINFTIWEDDFGEPLAQDDPVIQNP